jgi:hypothetical protein
LIPKLKFRVLERRRRKNDMKNINNIYKSRINTPKSTNISCSDELKFEFKFGFENREKGKGNRK